MATLHLTLDSLPKAGDSQIISASSLRLNLPRPAIKFYRHGWQSWTLTTWLDPTDRPLPIRAAEFRAKDEDPGYGFHKNHIGAWVGAVELGQDDILLLGALELSGRVELDGTVLHGFFEGEHAGSWLITRGSEDHVFQQYADLLGQTFGRTRFDTPPRVWCSWYSLFKWINEGTLNKILHELHGLPFDVFQIDDGWQIAHGDWEPNSKFSSGMPALAKKIRDTGRTAGLWLAPFMVAPDSQLAKDHPDWLLRNEQGELVPGGVTWGGNSLALDSNHPAVLDWLGQSIQKVTGWGYEYLKLDFLYQGALIGSRYADVPREVSYRKALQVIREAAGDAYILACGAPVIPSLGLCDGLRIGPDVTPFWRNEFLTTWLNNPNETSTANAIRTCVHRLWLRPLVNIDPDVMFFRSKPNALKPREHQMLNDLGIITGFKSTSDLPQWLSTSDKEKLRMFLELSPIVQKRGRYEFLIDGREMDFAPAIPLPSAEIEIPVWLAKYLGMLKIAWHQAIPAILASTKK